MMVSLLKKFSSIFLIIIALLYLFGNDSKIADEYSGRNVISKFGKSNDIVIMKNGERYYFVDRSFNSDTFPQMIDRFKVSKKRLFGENYLYLLCDGNLIVLNENYQCVLVFFNNTITAESIVNYMRAYYSLDKSNIIYNLDDLDSGTRSVYEELNYM